MARMIACCGLVCSECGAFIATQADDDELRRRTAAEWAESGAEIDPADINCDGCLARTGRVMDFAESCEIRACCAQKGTANCAACADYPCAKLAPCHERSPEARATLDALREVH